MEGFVVKQEREMKRMDSLKFKLPIGIITILIVAFMSVFLTSVLYLKNMIIKSNFDSMEKIVELSKDTVEAAYNARLERLSAVVGIPEITSTELSLESKINYLVENNMAINLKRIDIVDKDGNGYDSNGDHFDGSGEPGFKEIISGTESKNITGSYLSTLDGTTCIKYTLPIKNNNEIIGTLTFVEDGKDINEFIKGTTFGESGHVIMVEPNGHIVTGQEEELAEVIENDISMFDSEISSQEKYSDLLRLAKDMREGKETKGLYNIAGVDSYVKYRKIPVCDYEIALIVSKSEFLSNVKSLSIMLTIIILISLIVVSALIMLIIINMCKRLSALNSTVENFASGDFAIEIPEELLSSKDEIGNIFNSMNHSKESLKNIISSVKENSNTINNEIEGLLDTYKNINYLRI